jgi:small-conductance mechanosensitive channel
VGLAIGFGAQTLVKDIISGIFFLIDDAFRVGDYVEAGTAKGTVEHISLRSLTLRHPRGQLFTIPFGDLKMLTNFSRDYAVTKLDIRVRFDSDLDKIRKIIKQINRDMMQDEEIRKVMLSEIKSQGVRQMDDSAMILRVKYKTLPGEQFVVRRELYHRIQKAFREKGIEFAHRNVTVYLPPEIKSASADEQQGDTARKLIEAGAAAAAIAQAEEEAAVLKKKEESKK